MTSLGLLLTIAYTAVAALLLNLNLATRYGVLVKTSAIVLVTGLYGGVWYGYQGLMGWATPETLPEEFRVHWITVDEPVKETGEAGTIYFWIRALDEAGLPVGPPRAHQVPWDEDSAEAAEESLTRLEDGELLNGQLSRNLMTEEETSVEGADYAGDRTLSGDGGRLPDFEFVRVPPPALPPKPAPE